MYRERGGVPQASWGGRFTIDEVAQIPVSWDQIIGNHLYNRVTFDMNLLRSANAIESYYEIIDRYLRI